MAFFYNFLRFFLSFFILRLFATFSASCKSLSLFSSALSSYDYARSNCLIGDVVVNYDALTLVIRLVFLVVAVSRSDKSFSAVTFLTRKVLIVPRSALRKSAIN